MARYHPRFTPDLSRASFLALFPMARPWLPAADDKATLGMLTRPAEMSLEAFMGWLAWRCERPMPNLQGQDWTQESINDLIDHLEGEHHPFLILELDRLDWLLRQPGMCSDSLAERLRDWIARKFDHMRQEESALFPLCRTLENPFTAHAETGPALAQMFASHDQAGEILVQLCDQYAREAAVGQAEPALRGVLARIIQVLDAHVELEDTILLPAVAHASDIKRTWRFRQSLEVLQVG